MNRHRPFLLLGAILVYSAIAYAQLDDHILSLDSKITITRDRTLHVSEKFEIRNEKGFFDPGLHRRLGIKPSGPNRAKPGSFEDIRARVDDAEAVVRTTQSDETLEVGISAAPRSLSRGKHVIELSYTAKHQFLIYDDFEDLNQNITGTWSVPIERATVELNFPDRIPSSASITADTGTSSDFLFDCSKTNLPSGVRFETTHDIPPNQRLFVSARFERGYFISNTSEDGIRAVLENHPHVSPWVAFLAGLVVITSSAFLVSLLVLNASPGMQLIRSEHRLAMMVGMLSTVFSGVSLILLKEPYTAMPGFMVGAVASIILSGDPHGGEPFSLVAIGFLTNLAFYYLIARGVRSAWTHRYGNKLAVAATPKGEPKH